MQGTETRYRQRVENSVHQLDLELNAYKQKIKVSEESGPDKIVRITLTRLIAKSIYRGTSEKHDSDDSRCEAKGSKVSEINYTLKCVEWHAHVIHTLETPINPLLQKNC